jgi:hypothetical protein
VVAPQQLERAGARIDAAHRGRTAGVGGDAEAAGIGEAVQHAPARGALTNSASVVALVEEEAGLLAVLDVDAIPQTGLADLDLGGQRRAPDEALAHRQAFFAAHRDVAAFEDAGRCQPVDEDFDDAIEKPLHASGLHLQDEHAGIPVDDQTGQQVAFAGDDAVGIGVGGNDALAPAQRRIDTRLEKILDAVDLAPRQHAHREAARRVRIRDADEVAALVFDAAQAAGLEIGQRFEGAGKEPRVPGARRTIAILLEANDRQRQHRHSPR